MFVIELFLIFFGLFCFFLPFIVIVASAFKTSNNKLTNKINTNNSNSVAQKTSVGHIEIPNSHQEYYDSKRQKESIIYNEKKGSNIRKKTLFIVFLILAIILFASTKLLYSGWFIFFLTFYITLLLLSNKNQKQDMSLSTTEKKDFVTIDHDKYKESRIVYIDSIKENFGMYYIVCVDIDGCSFTSKGMLFNPRYVLDKIGIDSLTAWVNPRNHHDYVVDTNIIYRNRI